MNKHATAWLVLVLVAAAATGGCYNPKELEAFLLKPRREVSGLEYRVYPPDAISIVSNHVPEINGVTQRVRPDGKVNLVLLGEIYVAGKTPAEIQDALVTAASEYYEQADATVNVATYASQNYYVFGQVGRAGPVPWTGRDTLLDALARAHPTPLAWPERIILIRGERPHVGGRPAGEAGHGLYRLTGVRPAPPDQPRKRMTINLLAMIESADLSNNVLLMPNDVVYVQPNPLAKVGLALQSLLFPVRPAAATLGVPGRLAGAAAMP
jgi:polysaccharide export outer membrane protein